MRHGERRRKLRHNSSEQTNRRESEPNSGAGVCLCVRVAICDPGVNQMIGSLGRPRYILY
jgi:hypothetical protein